MRPNIQGLNQKDFELGLQNWVNQQPQSTNEKRVEAVGRILQCYDSKLEELDLSDLGLIILPPEIGNLTNLKTLNLEDNQLNTLPPEIGNLINLKTLNLKSNKLTNLPTEIGNLVNLQNLNLDNNQLTNLPPEIGNIIKLEYLDLTSNQLTTLPKSLFKNKINDHLCINLEENLIEPKELERLILLAQNSNIFISLLDHETPSIFNPNFTENNVSIAQEIIDRFSEDKKQEVVPWFCERNLNIFHLSILRCLEIVYPKNHQKMIDSFASLICDMFESENLKEKCLLISYNCLQTSNDNVSLSYVQMMLAQNSEKTPVAEMELQQLVELAKQEAIIKFLNEKAKNKIIEDENQSFDEIETYLAYLQAAPELGVNIPTGMLNQQCQNVSELDVTNAVTEFKEKNLQQTIAKQIYEDAELKKHPAINEIITEIGGQKQSGAQDVESEMLNKISSLIEQHIGNLLPIKNAENAKMPAENSNLSPSPATNPGNPQRGFLSRVFSSLSCTNTNGIIDPNQNGGNSR